MDDFEKELLRQLQQINFEAVEEGCYTDHALELPVSSEGDNTVIHPLSQEDLDHMAKYDRRYRRKHVFRTGSVLKAFTRLGVLEDTSHLSADRPGDGVFDESLYGTFFTPLPAGLFQWTMSTN